MESVGASATTDAGPRAAGPTDTVEDLGAKAARDTTVLARVAVRAPTAVTDPGGRRAVVTDAETRISVEEDAPEETAGEENSDDR